MQKAELGVLLYPGWAGSTLLMLGGALPCKPQERMNCSVPATALPCSTQRESRRWASLYTLGLFIHELSSDHVLVCLSCLVTKVLG